MSKFCPAIVSSSRRRSGGAVLELSRAQPGFSATTRCGARERLLEALEDSVRLRLMSDVPLGAMLSGGLDSSIIVALMARNMTEPVKTFSVGFAEDGEGNELADARHVAEAFGADHHELELSFAEEVDLDSSCGTSTSRSPISPRWGSLRCPGWPREHVTVALSGQGADELLGGYKKHRAAVAGRSAGGAARGRATGFASSPATAAALPTGSAHRAARDPRRDFLATSRPDRRRS